MNASHFALKQMILQGWPVLSVLFFFSVLSIAVILGRWRAFLRAGKKIPGVLEHIAAKIKLAATFEEKERLIQHEISSYMAPLENRISILGTIASTAPFIGLLGTVIGIIKAFRAVSISMGGGPAVVANGIAEALVTTAVGLLVAIPAVIAYNYFNRRYQAMEQQLLLAAGDIIYGISEKRPRPL